MMSNQILSAVARQAARCVRPRPVPPSANPFATRGFAAVAKDAKGAAKDTGPRKFYPNHPTDTPAEEAARIRKYRMGGFVFAGAGMCLFMPQIWANYLRYKHNLKLRKEETYQGIHNNLATQADIQNDLARRYKTKSKFRVLKDPEAHKASLKATMAKHGEGGDTNLNLKEEAYERRT